MDDKVHVIDFHWENFTPKMYHFSDKIEEFNLWKLDFNISKDKMCVGRFVNRSYIPCPSQERVVDYKQCPKCSEIFIGDLGCIFEPKCNGEMCEPAFCRKPHVVYLTFFNELPKVGMTSSMRIRERVIEQGADAYSLIKRVSNRKEARVLEKKISRILRIPQLQKHDEILKKLCYRVNRKGIEYKFNILFKALNEKFNIQNMELKYLDEYPISLPLRSKPRLRKIIGKHNGKVIGIKGKFLIFEANGLNALKLQEIPGRFIKF